MFSIPSSEDRWYWGQLLVHHTATPTSIRQVISSAVGDVLTSPQQNGNVLVGRFEQAQGEVAISILERPTRRTDKKFLWSALVGRQETRERHPRAEPIQYLLVKRSVLQDIGLYAGLSSFFEAMQEVVFGMFAYDETRLIFYPLGPDGTTMSFDVASFNTHGYSKTKFITNRIAELALAQIGSVEYG